MRIIAIAVFAALAATPSVAATNTATPAAAAADPATTTTKPAKPAVPAAKPAAPTVAAAKPAKPVLAAAKPAAPTVATTKPANQAVAKPATPAVVTTKPAKPAVAAAKSAKPALAAAKPMSLPALRTDAPAQVTQAAAAKPAADGTVMATPALWVVHGPKGKGTAYLLGSIHLLPKNVKWQTPEIAAAMKRSDTFVFETSMDDDSWTDAREKYPKEMLLPIDLSLPSFFDEAMRQDYQHVIFLIHGNPDGLVYLRPFVAAKVLQGQADGGDTLKGFSLDDGVDINVYKAAKARGIKNIVPLETVALHLHLLTDDGNIKEGMVELRSTLKRLLAETSDKTTSQRIYDAWRTGDVKTLAAAGPDNPQMPPEEHKEMLEDRNRAWIPKIEAMLNEKHTYFITVGAAHLVGKIGVPTLLREQGYRVDGPDSPDTAALNQPVEHVAAELPRRAPGPRTQTRLSDIRADKPCSGSCSDHAVRADATSKAALRP